MKSGLRTTAGIYTATDYLSSRNLWPLNDAVSAQNKPLKFFFKVPESAAGSWDLNVFLPLASDRYLLLLIPSAKYLSQLGGCMYWRTKLLHVLQNNGGFVALLFVSFDAHSWIGFGLVYLP